MEIRAKNKKILKRVKRKIFIFLEKTAVFVPFSLNLPILFRKSIVLRIVNAIFPIGGKTLENEKNLKKALLFFTDFHGKSIFRPRFFAIKTKNNA